MKEITLPIYDCAGKEIDTVTLDPAVFDGAINTAAIYQAVNAYRANQRKGLASTKTRGEVSGGGKKPWKQKGTGRARVGSIRSPLWRHGGVVFGPHPRDFSYELPKKIKKVAFKSVILEKIKENNLIVIDELKIDQVKTKEMVKVLSSLKLNLEKKGALLLVDQLTNSVKRVLRNIAKVTYNLVKDANVYEVLAADKVVITKEALKMLTNRIKE
ncbi:MAG: 50S ribosomal protein L4 [Candidatus Omnitrophota bacterium]|jgi:large subunit ribosomal protein L4